MINEFSRKTSPIARVHQEEEKNMLATHWKVAYERLSTMPPEQMDLLEKSLLELQKGAGVTVAQMAVLRAIQARRVAQRLSRYRRKGR